MPRPGSAFMSMLRLIYQIHTRAGCLYLEKLYYDPGSRYHDFDVTFVLAYGRLYQQRWRFGISWDSALLLFYIYC